MIIPISDLGEAIATGPMHNTNCGEGNREMHKIYDAWGDFNEKEDMIRGAFMCPCLPKKMYS